MKLAVSQQFDEKTKGISFVTTLSSDFTVSRSERINKISLGSSNASKAQISFDDEELAMLLEVLQLLAKKD